MTSGSNSPSVDMAAPVADLEKARQVSRSYAAAVRPHFRGRLRRIRLYGSAARGDWTRDSDVDILVLLDVVSREDRAWLVERAMEVGVLDSGILIQPLPMAEAEFDTLRDRERLLALDIEREGVDL